MKCKIKMTTTQEEYIPEQLISAMFGEENEGAPSTERDTFEIYAEGEIVKQENKVIIRYEEGEASGLGGSIAELFFDKSEPKNITLTRTGGVSVIMCFKEGSRHTCVYNTEVMPLELCIYTKRVDNRLFDMKYIEITYFIEIGGSLAQKTVMKLEISTL